MLVSRNDEALSTLNNSHQLLCTLHKGTRTQCLARTNDALLNQSGFRGGTINS